MRLPGANLATFTFATTYQVRFAGDRVFVQSEQNVGNPDVRVSTFAGTLVPRATAAGADAGTGTSSRRP